MIFQKSPNIWRRAKEGPTQILLRSSLLQLIIWNTFTNLHPFWFWNFFKVQQGATLDAFISVAEVNGNISYVEFHISSKLSNISKQWRNKTYNNRNQIIETTLLHNFVVEQTEILDFSPPLQHLTREISETEHQNNDPI